MAQSSKPTVLLVHGSWHTPKHYQKQLDLLKQNGFPVCCPLQPSVGKAPPIGLMEDAEAIRDTLKRLIDDEERNVIVVAHSYGGVVTSQAADPAFAVKERRSAGKKGGVIQLLFVCAFVLPLGESLGSALGDPNKLPPFIEVRDDGMCMMLEPGRRFYHDLSEEDQRKWVDELVWCPAVAQLTRITQAAYMHHPSTYLFCENDQALPLEVQRGMVEAAEGTGSTFQKESCGAGHSPFLGRPKSILSVVKKIAITAASV